MGKGIREMAMSPDEPEKKQEELFKPYPSQYDSQYGSRPENDWAGFNDEKYKKNEELMQKEDEEKAKLISVIFTIRRKELGKEFDMDSEAYEYNITKEVELVKEMAYDRLTLLLGKGFESRYGIESFDADDSYEEFEVVIMLRPLEYKP